MSLRVPGLNRRALGRALLGVGLWVSQSALIKVAPTAAQKKLIEHYTNNDPIWTVLRTAAVGEDRAKGQFTATFPAELAALAGKPLAVSGFITPLEARPRLRHFILTRRSTTCPFCPPNEPTEAVEVRLASDLAMTSEQVTVAGRLALVAASEDGLFYRIDDGALLKRG